MNNSKSIKILHLARWYPNRYDSMFGLFVKRHFEAVGIKNQTHLIYVHPVGNLELKYDIEVNRNGNCSEIIIYYRDFNSKFMGINELVKGWKFFFAMRKGFEVLKKNELSYNFIHVHVLTRMGLIAWIINIFKGIPYGITEHWSRYLPATNGFNGFLRKWLTRKIISRASFVSTVTENLHQAMISHGLKNPNYFVLPNVVNPRMQFNANIKKNEVFTFIHISTFEDKSKNISGIIRVIAELSMQRDDFRFHFIGDGMDFLKMQKYAGEIILDSSVYKFTGLLEDEDLAKSILESNVMVIFSNYENFPVVINEALSFGIPVLSTRVGGIPEVINSSNGLLINAGDEEALLTEMIKLLDKEYEFDSVLIKEEFKDKYSSEKIGEILVKYYLSL